LFSCSMLFWEHENMQFPALVLFVKPCWKLRQDQPVLYCTVRKALSCRAHMTVCCMRVRCSNPSCGICRCGDLMHGGMETWEANQRRLGTPRPMNSQRWALWLDASFFCLGLLVGMVRSQCSQPRWVLSSPSVLRKRGGRNVPTARIDCSDRAGVHYSLFNCSVSNNRGMRHEA